MKLKYMLYTAFSNRVANAIAYSSQTKGCLFYGAK